MRYNKDVLYCRLMDSIQNILVKTGYQKHRNVVLTDIRMSLFSRTYSFIGSGRLILYAVHFKKLSFFQ